MKRRELVRHLERHGCRLLRQGGRHSVYVNSETKTVSTVPRHAEINDRAVPVPPEPDVADDQARNREPPRGADSGQHDQDRIALRLRLVLPEVG